MVRGTRLAGKPGGVASSRATSAEPIMTTGVAMKPLTVPIRTCVGCRKRASASELLRVVAVVADSERMGIDDPAGVPGQSTTPAPVRIEPDPRRVRPGRGAHIHPDPACLTLAVRRHAFKRALRVTGVIDVGSLGEHLGNTSGGTPVPPGQAR